MFHIVAALTRRRGLSPEEFQTHWRGPHAEIARKIPGLRRYVQNHTRLAGYRARTPAFDGVAELSFDDRAAFIRAQSSRELAAAGTDEARFLERGQIRIIYADVRPIVEGPVPPGAAKLISFLSRRHDISREEFSRHWHKKHATIAARIPGMRRYVQYHAQADEADPAPAYDGIPMAWFDGTQALRASEDSDAYARTRADEAHFLEPGTLCFVIANEHVIVD